MKQHKNTYEQYCFVRGGNVIFEETVFHDGIRTRRCSRYETCVKEGGCKNSALFSQFGENAVDAPAAF